MYCQDKNFKSLFVNIGQFFFFLYPLRGDIPIIDAKSATAAAAATAADAAPTVADTTKSYCATLGRKNSFFYRYQFENFTALS